MQKHTILQVLDSSSFADPEYIDTALRKYETSSSSATQSDSSDADEQSADKASTYSNGRGGGAAARHSASDCDRPSERLELDNHRSYPLPAAARHSSGVSKNFRE